ncbi:MAG: tetratricopeptide repeat protein [Acidobacteriota bacterium]
MDGRLLTAGVTLVLLAPACLTSTQATRLQKDLNDVKRQVFKLQQDSSGSQRRLREIAEKLADGAPPSGTDPADLGNTVQILLDQIQSLSVQMKEMNKRLDMLQQKLESTAPAGRFQPPPTQADARRHAGPAQVEALVGAPESHDDAIRTFNTAYADYAKGNYELAMMGFSALVKDHPDHPLANDARYWIGECLYSQGRFSNAVAAFDRAIRSCPSCAKTPAALLKKGLSQMHAGQTARGVTTLQSLIQTNPDSEEARLAAEKLKQMGLRSP